jgi:subtilisin family serine protease
LAIALISAQVTYFHILQKNLSTNMKVQLIPKNTSVSTTVFSAAGQDADHRFTGRRIVVLSKSASSVAFKTAALQVANIRDYSSSSSGPVAVAKALSQADGVVFDKLKVAVINADAADQVEALMLSRKTRGMFLLSEPERYVYALASRPGNRTKFDDDAMATWGIHAANAINSPYTGKGVRIAILDSGLSLKHPDFRGRKIKKKSFTRAKTVEDHFGHGSHCAGIAAGNMSKEKGFRYGVAKDAELFIGKVLTNQGVGEDNNILAGIEWALQNKCRVISMSLGSEAKPGDKYSQAYEAIAQRALESGAIILAAAGNDSNRKRGKIALINHPANCPSIMSVAALDKNLDVANFSCGAIRKKGGKIDIAGPGVHIFSASSKGKYEVLSGTSMATPFVAGMAAILWEEFPKATANQIWMKLIEAAKRLRLPAADVGAGLVFYP